MDDQGITLALQQHIDGMAFLLFVMMAGHDDSIFASYGNDLLNSYNFV